jgi:hypothetical protein
MIKRIMFLKWAALHRLPVMQNGKLTEYGERVFGIWSRRIAP